MNNKKKNTSKKASKSSTKNPKNKNTSRVSNVKQPMKKSQTTIRQNAHKTKENLTLLSKEKNKKDTKSQNTSDKPVPSKKLLKALVCAGIILVCLAGRIGFLQFVQGTELKELANRQQTTNRIINAKRGTIYDSTGKALATSARVDTVTINPERIKEDNKEMVAKAFSDIFTLDYNETLEKVKSTNSIETIAKKVEQDKIDELKAWMKANKMYAGINIDEDVKRYYPYGNLASNLIGFCGTDNQGLEGLELKWDNLLTGVPGKIITTKDAVEEFIPDKNETYIAAQNGSNLTLSLDVNIQSIVEKYLKQAVIENDCKRGGTAIVMKPSTGDILAMATYPDYDLNNPYQPNDSMKATWETLSSSERSNSLYKMWRNRCVADTYEPGSTFKIITASVGLEEGLVSTDTASDFYCPGYEMVSGHKIYCWKTSSHGPESLRQALMNSCNPSLMQLGKRIGAPTLYKYYEAFGLFNKTSIDTASETNSNFWDLDNVGPVELATMSFGQRFTITPIQLITAVSAIANDGVLMQPRLVKQIENTDTHTTTTVDTTSVRQVLSKDTCDKVMDMLASVVNDGTGRYGQVKGYSVAGKTGTSEPNPAHPEEGYVASYIAISPTENPEVVVLVTLYNPKGDSHQGGQIAGPVVSQILGEVLPYLGIPSDDLSESNASQNLTTTPLPDVRNKTVAEAKKAIENAGFICKLSGTDTSLIVTDQVPKPGTALLKGASVNLYSTGNEARISQEVPNLKGMSFAQARNALKAKNLNIHVTGSGTVLSQDPMAGTSVEEGTVININLHQQIQDAH